MTTQQKYKRVVQAINPECTLLKTWPLKGGVSSQMTALEIAHPNGQKQKRILRQPSDKVFKQNPNSAKQEYQLLQTIHAANLPTPTPYYLDETGQIFSTPYLIIEYIEGDMQFAPSDINMHMRDLATQLANIHRIDCTDLSFLPECINGCVELCHEQSSKNKLFDETVIRHTLKSYGPLQQKNATALLHGDFWPGNTLWQNEQLVAIIDWDDAERGDPLIDLAKTRSEIVWIFGIDALNTFTNRYQTLMPVNYTHLPYWDLCAALRFIRFSNSDLTKLATYFTSFDRSDITKETIQKHVNHFIHQALKAL